MKVKVLNLDQVPDSSGEVFDPEGISLAEGHVPVQFEFEDDIGSYLGTAVLSRESDGVYAELEILPHQVDAVKTLYPAVGGSVFERLGKVLLKTEIRSVGMSTSKNADSRIATVGQQTQS